MNKLRFRYCLLSLLMSSKPPDQSGDFYSINYNIADTFLQLEGDTKADKLEILQVSYQTNVCLERFLTSDTHRSR